MYIYSTSDRFSKIQGTYLPGPGHRNKTNHKRNKTIHLNNSIMSIKNSPRNERSIRVCDHGLQSKSRSLEGVNISPSAPVECDVCYEHALRSIGSKRRTMNSERRALQERLGNSAIDEECMRRTIQKEKHLNARGDRLSVTQQDVDWYDVPSLSDIKPSFNIATNYYFQKVAVNDSLKYFSQKKQLQERQSLPAQTKAPKPKESSKRKTRVSQQMKEVLQNQKHLFAEL